MNYPNFYPGYQGGYYTPNVPDQLAQLRQSQQMQSLQQPQGLQPLPQIAQPAQQSIQGGVGGAPNGIIWVSGKQEADSYFVVANSAVPLWDTNNPVIYLRKADSTGKPSTIVYDLVERTDTPVPQPQEQVDFTKFVTWDKLDEVLAERLKKPARAPKTKEDIDNA
ncbi:hypothetical protein [Acutalibacter sp. 1XD8-36]|uniref:hypothetical protein n=1 Tax=Acutalibacter sp. 1XD8-36 TaxID=2320852 RepID=UPI001411FAFD|nr:hypothetical protein [Acutalibacter sp. 1XD8-36]NBJ89833.1 hypothetical protein [Acutalibacter sp. 1XD8-36]